MIPQRRKFLRNAKRRRLRKEPPFQYIDHGGTDWSAVDLDPQTLLQRWKDLPFEIQFIAFQAALLLMMWMFDLGGQKP